MRSELIISMYAWAVAATLIAPSAIAQRAVDFSDPTLAQDRAKVPEATSRSDAATTITAPSGSSVAAGSRLFVGAVTFDGLRILDPSVFADVVAGWVGNDWNTSDLSALANEVAARMHAQGYKFASAKIDPQRIVGGVLIISVDEGSIDELRFEGDAPPAVRRALAPLATAQPQRSDVVERHILLASDIDGVRIHASRFVREGERGILIVRATQDAAFTRVELNNAGTKPIGREQARFDVNLNGVLASDDSVTMSYATTPAQPRELQFGALRYEKRLSHSGTELAVTGSASLTRPGAYLAPLNIKNRSWYAAASLLQPLLRRRKASVWIAGELGVRDLAQWRSGRRFRDDRLTTARITLYGYSDFAGGRLRASGTLTQGLDLFGATRSGDPLASRFDADGTFTAAAAWVDWTRDLGSDFSIRLAAQGQVSSEPLLVSEETSLGGTVFLRGYDWGERSGDEGAMAMAELRYLWNNPLRGLKRVQLYTYVDGGRVSNHRNGFGSGELASTGGGVRLDVTDTLGATLEIGVPLSGNRYDTGDRSPKVNFSIVRAF